MKIANKAAPDSWAEENEKEPSRLGGNFSLLQNKSFSLHGKGEGRGPLEKKCRGLSLRKNRK